ncbi:hypothetical protein Scep_011922 [Stephania cephalantha]|uniref:Uncharacterized protein n=1 Tax=Stephania cephalantha TaxID=152367 RepID=A0AAP0JEA1_9MAGN
MLVATGADDNGRGNAARDRRGADAQGSSQMSVPKAAAARVAATTNQRDAKELTKWPRREMTTSGGAAQQRRNAATTVAILLAMRSADRSSGGKTTGNVNGSGGRRGWLDGGAAPAATSAASPARSSDAGEEERQRWRWRRGERRGATAWWHVIGPIDPRRDNNSGQGVVTSTKLDDAMDSNGLWIGDLHLRPWNLGDYSRVSGAHIEA